MAGDGLQLTRLPTNEYVVANEAAVKVFLLAT